MSSEILVVSGLPRSGTSLMMQMLDNGGIAVLSDGVRAADTDNPRGYYELEKVKRLRQDAAWLPEARGKAMKMVSQLLYDLPPRERYRVIFMERDFDEMLLSQEKMLARLGRPAAPREQIIPAYHAHLDKLHRWLGEQANFAVMKVSYNAVLERPQDEARRVCEFLGRGDAAAMARSVDTTLYRNRRPVAG
jgi:hypothetical protein